MLKKIVMSFALACCLGTVVHAQEPKMGGVINAVIQPEPPGLMLAMIQNGPTQMVSGNIFEGLLRYSPKLEPLPGLAESWTISEDGKVYTFKLKPGVHLARRQAVHLGRRAVLDRDAEADPCARARQSGAGRQGRGARRSAPSCSR